jgi:hypothetical protein
VIECGWGVVDLFSQSTLRGSPSAAMNFRSSCCAACCCVERCIVNRWFGTLPQTFKKYQAIAQSIRPYSVYHSATYRVRGRFFDTVHSRHGRLGRLLLGLKKLPSQLRPTQNLVRLLKFLQPAVRQPGMRQAADSACRSPSSTNRNTV